MRVTGRNARALATLGWWLGVRGGDPDGPRRVRWKAALTDDGTRIRLCDDAGDSDGTSTARDRPVLLVVPGLHMDGPEDRRMARLGAVFASTGATVVMPHLDAFEALWIRDDRHPRAAAAQLIAASDWARRALAGRPQVAFSVSFGAAPLMHLLAARELQRAIVFGGFATLGGTLRFALDRRANPSGDPLNGPAIYRNLASRLLPTQERAGFEAACLAFCAATWSRSGRPALKDRHRYAHALADARTGLSRLGAELLQEATGLVPGAADRVEALLGDDDARAPFAWAEPLNAARTLVQPIDVIHGRDDDVIPHTEGAALAAAVPRGRLFLSGRVGHTSQGRGAGGLGELAAALGALAMLTDAR